MAVAELEGIIARSRRGDTAGALGALMALLAARPTDGTLLALAGELLTALGRLREARDHYRRAARASPADAAAWRRLGNAELQLDEPLAAVESLRTALTLEPGNPRAHNNLGRAFERLNRWPQAYECYAASLAHDQGYAIGALNLGRAALRLSRHAAALEAFRTAVRLDATLALAWCGQAEALVAHGAAAEALAAAEQALRLQSPFPEAWLAAATALELQQRDAEERAALEQALAERADFPAALAARAYYRRRRGDRAGALADFARALELAPDFDAVRLAAVMAEVPLLAADDTEVVTGRARYTAALRALRVDLAARPPHDPAAVVGAILPFFLAYEEVDHLPTTTLHGDLCADLMARWRDSGPPRRAGTARGERRLRVGIVSAHVADHSVYHAILRGWLAHLPAERFALELYNLGGQADAETEEAKARVADVEAGPRALVRWVETIEARAPDVLLYPEIGMDRTTLQLASLRLAPLQAVSWGHPESSGLPTIDYYLSAEAFEPDGAERHYRERLVRLPGLGCCYRPLPPTPLGAADALLALDDSAPVLLCAGTPFKYAPKHDALLIEIAKALGRCRFHFFRAPGAGGALSERLQARLQAAFRAAGLDPEQYLVLQPWASRAQFRELLGRADLMLDTVGFSGFNTVVQALEAGLPVVSLRGRFLRGRLGAGLLEQAGLADRVATTPAEYVRLAVSLARDAAARAAVRARIATGLPPLLDDRRPVAALAEFLDRAARRA